MALAPTVEREMIVNNGIILRKYFLDVSQDEQRRQFEARIKPGQTLEAEPDGHRISAALVGLHGGLPTHVAAKLGLEIATFSVSPNIGATLEAISAAGVAGLIVTDERALAEFGE